MIHYKCDKCGAAMTANDDRRFIVRIEVYAAAGHVDLVADEKSGNERQLDAVLKQLRAADPDEIEDQTYRSFRFDLCDDCRRKLLLRPLG